MNKDKKIQAIRKACILVNPKASAGHNFEVGYGRCSFCDEPRILRDRRVLRTVVDEKTGGSISEAEEKNIDQTDFPCSKNLFRPIRLADVLLAIGKTGKSCAIDDTGSFCESDFGGFVPNYTKQWNLRKDSLEEQSKNCISFIHELIQK